VLSNSCQVTAKLAIYSLQQQRILLGVWTFTNDLPFNPVIDQGLQKYFISQVSFFERKCLRSPFWPYSMPETWICMFSSPLQPSLFSIRFNWPVNSS